MSRSTMIPAAAVLGVALQPPILGCSEGLTLESDRSGKVFAIEFESAEIGDGGVVSVRPEIARWPTLGGGTAGEPGIVAGRWEGTVSDISFESGSSRVQLVIHDNGSGRLTFGDAMPPPKPTGPTGAFPWENLDWSDPYVYSGKEFYFPMTGIFEGFQYPLRTLLVAPEFDGTGLTRPVTILANSRDLYLDWCALQPGREGADGNRTCTIPGEDYGVLDCESEVVDTSCEMIPFDRRQCDIYDGQRAWACHTDGTCEEVATLLGRVPCAQHRICSYACPTCDGAGCNVVEHLDIALNLEFDGASLQGWLRFSTFESPGAADPLSDRISTVRFTRVEDLPR